MPSEYRGYEIPRPDPENGPSAKDLLDDLEKSDEVTSLCDTFACDCYAISCIDCLFCERQNEDALQAIKEDVINILDYIPKE